MSQNWETVRVFISSTFRDMHAERDHLVKVVFPELRERMAKHNLYLVDVDLRWGVTQEEAEHGKVLELCLDEIERCRPFFISILGERYGFVPSKVPEDTEVMRPWLAEFKGHSLTALEIIHGVLRCPKLAQRAFFYFRDSSFVSQVPESKRADFTAESPEATLKLTALKEKIKLSGRPIMDNYPCRWDNKKGHLVDLDTFGQRVLEDLWTALCAVYPEEALEADPLIIERQMHEAFAEERSRLHVRREEQAKQLTKYVQGTDRRPVVITGESGCGKSAFLANWYRKYVNENPNDFVLAYFIGASPDSTNHLSLLRNICAELKRQFGLKEEIPNDNTIGCGTTVTLSGTLEIMLAAASRSKQRIIVLLDSLDQLLPQEGAQDLHWLLPYVPEKTWLVVSTTEGKCLDALRGRHVKEIALPPLTANEQRQIVNVVLSEWGRKLDEKQVAALLVHHGAKNPLYLRVALEELRLFGKFEQLTERIKALAENIPGLFEKMLIRLEEDHGRWLVSDTFSLLSCSRYGLSETELLQLLRRGGEEQFPSALWARLYRISKMYLVQRGDLISFFHRQLAEAVTARYLDSESKRLAGHSKLANYFLSQANSIRDGTWKGETPRGLLELLFHLKSAGMWGEIVSCLKDPRIFTHLWPGAYGINFDRGLYISPDPDALEPASLSDLPPKKRSEVGYAIADAFGENARRMIRMTQSFEQPWPKTAQHLREHDIIGFAKYRDTFYSFTRLAGRTAEFAIAAFEDSPDGRERSRAFIHSTADISSFLHYLHNFGSGETGLSHALEDDAYPGYKAWEQLALSRQHAWAWFTKAANEDQLGLRRDATISYRRFIELAPAKDAEYVETARKRLRELEASNRSRPSRFDQTKQDYNKTSEINQREADAWFNKGNSLFRVGRYDEAIKCYDKVLEINTRDVLAWYNKGVAEDQLSQRREAAISYRKFIELATDKDAKYIEIARKRLRMLEGK